MGRTIRCMMCISVLSRFEHGMLRRKNVIKPKASYNILQMVRHGCFLL